MPASRPAPKKKKRKGKGGQRKARPAAMESKMAVSLRARRAAQKGLKQAMSRLGKSQVESRGSGSARRTEDRQQAAEQDSRFMDAESMRSLVSTRSHASENPHSRHQVPLTQLSREDKSRIGSLIYEVVRLDREKKSATAEIEKYRRQNEVIHAHTTELRSRFAQSLNLLRAYQRKLRSLQQDREIRDRELAAAKAARPEVSFVDTTPFEGIDQQIAKLPVAKPVPTDRHLDDSPSDSAGAVSVRGSVSASVAGDRGAIVPVAVQKATSSHPQTLDSVTSLSLKVQSLQEELLQLKTSMNTSRTNPVEQTESEWKTHSEGPDKQADVVEAPKETRTSSPSSHGDGASEKENSDEESKVFVRRGVEATPGTKAIQRMLRIQDTVQGRPTKKSNKLQLPDADIRRTEQKRLAALTHAIRKDLDEAPALDGKARDRVNGDSRADQRTSVAFVRSRLGSRILQAGSHGVKSPERRRRSRRASPAVSPAGPRQAQRSLALSRLIQSEIERVLDSDDDVAGAARSEPGWRAAGTSTRNSAESRRSKSRRSARRAAETRALSEAVGPAHSSREEAFRKFRGMALTEHEHRLAAESDIAHARPVSPVRRVRRVVPRGTRYSKSPAGAPHATASEALRRRARARTDAVFADLDDSSDIALSLNSTPARGLRHAQTNNFHGPDRRSYEYDESLLHTLRSLEG